MTVSMPSRKDARDLIHQQNQVLEYITEIAQELSQMAQRAGCDILSRDLRQAIMRANGLTENPAEIVARPDDAEAGQRKRL